VRQTAMSILHCQVPHPQINPYRSQRCPFFRLLSQNFWSLAEGNSRYCTQPGILGVLSLMFCWSLVRSLFVVGVSFCFPSAYERRDLTHIQSFYFRSHMSRIRFVNESHMNFLVLSISHKCSLRAPLNHRIQIPQHVHQVSYRRLKAT